MKRVLLLGGFGFIGTNILDYIVKYLLKKYSVVVLDRTPTHFSGKHFECVEKVFVGDFSDNSFLESIFASYSFDYVFHLISSTVPTTSGNMVFDVESNLVPTIHLLNTMKTRGVSNIVYLSSGGAIYGECNEKKAHKEDDDLHPLSSYGIVKLTIEKYLFLFQKLYGINPLILRLSNPYGPYHYSAKQGIVNVALRKAVNQEPITVWGNGDSKKDYIYIQDFCTILFALLNAQISNGVFNVASGNILSLNQILSEIKGRYPNLKWENKPASEYDVLQFELDTLKLKNTIGDFPFSSFEEGLSQTIKWLLEESEKK